MDRRTAHNRQKLEKMLAVLQGGRRLLVVMQDHPDPDAIACAAALRRLSQRMPDLSCTLMHGGPIGRAENRALVEYLGLQPMVGRDMDPDHFDRVAMVDTQPGTGNNALPEGLRPHIVIDHHPIRRATRGVPFTDIRKSYGAASTILCGYLQAAGIEPDVKLATALFYGIRSDTQDLAREAGKADRDAHFYLYPRANLRMLARIEHGTLPLHYFRLLHKALDQTTRAGRALVAVLGPVENPDMMGEVADLLVRLEDIAWCLCSGTFNGRLLISLRCRPDDGISVDAGQVARKTVGRNGTAGGHQLIAGGQVPLVGRTEKETDRIQKRLPSRFLRAVGQQQAPRHPLVGPP